MAGIVAIVAHDRRVPVAHADIESLASTYESLRGSGPRERASAGEWAQAIVIGASHDDRAAIERRGDSWVAQIGLVIHEGEVVGAPLDVIEGHFGLISYDAETETLIVATDPRAFQPIYVAGVGARTYVSDSALVLAKHLRLQPSRLGILTFIRTGYHFGTLTNWEGVARLDPGACIEFGRQRRDHRFYWRTEPDRDVAAMGLDDAVDRCNETALRAVKDWVRPSGEVWADLTGGFDSRLLCLLLDKAGVPFEANTRGDYTDDRRIAGMIANKAGWPWRDVTVPENWDDLLSNTLRRAVTWSDAHLDPFELAWVLWAHSQLSQTHPRVLYAGGGEHLRAYCWRQEFPLAGKTSRVNWNNWMDLRLIHPINLSVFADDPTPEVRADMLRRMKKWDEPYTDELNTTRLDLLFSYKMTGHFAIYRSADAAVIRADVPLYSKAMYRTAISVSPRYRRNHRLVRHMIGRLDRRIASVETDSGGPAEPWRVSNVHRFLPYYTQVARRGANKLGQKFIGRRVLPAFENWSWWSPPRARARVIDDHLGELPERWGSLLDRQALDDLLRRAPRDDFADSGLLGRIAAVEISLQLADAALD
jgi:hypothetical protein